MHFSTLLLLPVLVAADQAALFEKASGWFDKAKSYIPTAVPNPVEAGAAKFADQRVERINIRNWERKLGPKLDTEEEWMVYMTGGNKSCFGRCGPVDVVWNVSLDNSQDTCKTCLILCAGVRPSTHCSSSFCGLTTIAFGIR